MSFWAKIPFERQIYVIDLDRIDTFICAANGKISFWLPESKAAIIITPDTAPDSYHQVKDYIHQCMEKQQEKKWLKFQYERHDYLINIRQISLFAYHPVNKKITFWLPNSHGEIVLHPHTNEAAYEQVIEYIREQTNYCLEDE